MQICRNCLYGSYHPLNLLFDNTGLCSGCQIHEEKNTIDWSEKKLELIQLVKAYQSKNKGPYDCIVPVSGARDSFFIVDYVVNVLKLHPLLVTYNKHYNTREAFYNLAIMKRTFDCDLITKTVDPQKVKNITRATLRRFGSIYWHCLAGHTKLPVEIAIAFRVPLIIWGAHQGVEQVGMFSHHHKVEMSRRYRKDHDLMGFEAEDLVSKLDFVNEEDVIPYVYPSDSEIERHGIRGIYLSNYVRWDTFTQHMKMARYGTATRTQTRSFDNFSNADCYMYSDLHDYIKYLKHGYGTVVDHAVRDIRMGHVDRETGLQLVNKYIQRTPKHKNLFLKWLGLQEAAFDYIIDQHRVKTVWSRSEDWSWCEESSHLISALDALRPLSEENVSDSYFPETSKINTSDHDGRFILYGKGS